MSCSILCKVDAVCAAVSPRSPRTSSVGKFEAAASTQVIVPFISDAGWANPPLTYQWNTLGEPGRPFRLRRVEPRSMTHQMSHVPMGDRSEEHTSELQSR